MPGGVVGPACWCRVGMRCGGLQVPGWKANLQRRVGKEDFCFSLLDFSVSLGGALRRYENRMAARKLVRKPVVG